MKRSMKFAWALAAAAVAPFVLAATAQADEETVYFSTGRTNCAIYGDGTVGCDLYSPERLNYYVGDTYIPMPFPITDIVIDQPWLPAHPTFAAKRHTLAGGNPNISDVKTGSDTWGPVIEHAGSSCRIGFHGSFSCTAKGRGFVEIGPSISASA